MIHGDTPNTFPVMDWDGDIPHPTMVRLGLTDDNGEKVEVFIDHSLAGPIGRFLVNADEALERQKEGG